MMPLREVFFMMTGMHQAQNTLVSSLRNVEISAMKGFWVHFSLHLQTAWLSQMEAKWQDGYGVDHR